MTTLTLRYGEEAATGLPRLEDPSGRLSPADLDALRGEIDRQFERVASGPDEQLLTLGGADGDVPRHFRVLVREREKRCPTLLLEAVDPPAPDAAPEEPPASVPTTPGRWQPQFLAEIAELLAGNNGEPATRSPLDFVLADLRALLRKDPRRFAFLLLAGYLHVGDALSRRHGETKTNRYARAAEELHRLAGDALPEGTLSHFLAEPGAQQSTVPERETRSWLRRFFSFG